MCESAKRVLFEMSCADAFEIVNALLDRADKLILMGAPKRLVLTTISRAEAVNKILRNSDYDYWENRVFEQLKERVKGEYNHESIQ